MTDLPAPLTPPECDLRDYEWMPLDVNRLLTSETWILGSADECKASVTLWCEAWRQLPAASLPDDDRMLAHLSRLGPGWQAVKEAVLRSWVKCSDGRLYHPVVAEKARESWELKLAQRARTRAATEARRRYRESRITNDAPPTMQRDEIETCDDTKNATNDATETSQPTLRSPPDQTRPDPTRPDQNISSLRSGEARDDAAPPAPAQRRGSRLPADWEPSEADHAFAIDLGLRPARIAAQFRDYWHAKAGAQATKLDWSATWRNWCRREADRDAGQGMPVHPIAPLRPRDGGNWAAQKRQIDELFGPDDLEAPHVH